MMLHDLIDSDMDLKPWDIIAVEGCNSDDETDPYHEIYYKGPVSGVPASLLIQKVLSTGYLMGAKCPVAEIAYLPPWFVKQYNLR